LNSSCYIGTQGCQDNEEALKLEEAATSSALYHELKSWRWQPSTIHLLA
jgi:hypothetical protein